MNNKKKQHFINGEIRASEVRLSDKGIMSLKEALKLAEEQEMDLVMVSKDSNPPVCKIMNYQKFLYEQGKREKQKSLEIKEIKIGPNISDNDLEYRINHISEFLKKGHKVKITMQFRGREMAFVTKGEHLILNLILKINEFGLAESLPKLEGNKMFVTIKPISKK